MIPNAKTHLLDLLTQPSEALVDYITSLEGPLVVLGAGGKMGPTLCVRAQRAAKVASFCSTGYRGKSIFRCTTAILVGSGRPWKPFDAI